MIIKERRTQRRGERTKSTETICFCSRFSFLHTVRNRRLYYGLFLFDDYHLSFVFGVCLSVVKWTSEREAFNNDYWDAGDLFRLFNFISSIFFLPTTRLSVTRYFPCILCVWERKRAIENLIKACAVLTIWLISVIGTLLDGGGDGDDWRWLFLRGKAGGAPGGDIGCTFTLHSLLPRFGDILAGKLSVFVHCDRLRTIWRRFRFVFCCCFFFFVIWYSVFEFNACDWRMSQWISLEHDVIKREFPNQT